MAVVCLVVQKIEFLRKVRVCLASVGDDLEKECEAGVPVVYV